MRRLRDLVGVASTSMSSSDSSEHRRRFRNGGFDEAWRSGSVLWSSEDDRTLFSEGLGSTTSRALVGDVGDCGGVFESS